MMNSAVIMILLALATSAVAQQARVTVQVIEVPHRELTKWMGAEKLTGKELHERAVKLAATGEAEIVETNVLIARSGEKALLESIVERIYPSEREVSDGLDPLPPPVDPKLLEIRYFRPSDAQPEFETRNNGTTLEIEPTVAKDGKVVDLRFQWELVDRVALTTWTEFIDQWGDASIRTPEFENHEITGHLTLVTGTFELCNVFMPKPTAVPAATTRQLVFVRADILPHPKP
jgi:hypothetical protein